MNSHRVKVYISAGLIIYAKVLLKSDRRVAAIDIIKKTGQFTPSKIKIIRNTIQILLEENEEDAAQQILEYAKENSLNNLFYQIFSFKILAKREGPGKILEWGSKLVLSEFKDLEIYLDLICALKGKKEFKRDFEKIITQAKKDYPLNKEDIDQAAGLN